MNTPQDQDPSLLPDSEVAQDEVPRFKEPPEDDALAKKWNQRISAARQHWEKFHKRVRHNRNLVAGFNWEKDPKTAEFYEPRANLIHGTITAILPNIYARNPEISAVPNYRAENLRLFCKTIETVTNREQFTKYSRLRRILI